MFEQYIDQAMGKQMAQKEGLIKEVLDAVIPGWSMVDIKRRCEWVIRNDSLETLYVDGQPELPSNSSVLRMSSKPDVILVVEGDQELVECPHCEGSEGYNDEEEGWIECSACGGEGGYWRQRTTDNSDSAHSK